ncbi:MAG: response regulator [Vicinamibacteria bacterium]|nr:response regulator [Vicinamibacteria bacterium]
MLSAHARDMGLRLLVASDEEPSLSAFQKHFTACGFQVDCARELEEAEALASRIHYALVVADLRLAGVIGVEGLHLVGFVHNRCPATRLILLADHGSPEIESEARRLGADAFIRKPKSMPDLAQVVFGLLEGAA